MDYDDLMLFVKQNPDCTSLDISKAFGVTVAKSFTAMNEVIDKGLAFRTTMRSPTNGKKIYGYRVKPGFDEVNDNGDGSMKRAEVIRNLRRLIDRGLDWEAAMHLESHNEWRRANGVKQIERAEVFG